MRPFVVDANVINYFQRERLEAVLGPACEAIDCIKLCSAIALDADGHCEAEWIECAAGTYPLALKDWIADMMAAEKIQLFPLTCDSMFRELSTIGVPKKDHKWVRLARSVPSEYIVTEDIDLFDPSKKAGCSPSARDKIKRACKGPVAKHLRKRHGISVIVCERVPGAIASSNS